MSATIILVTVLLCATHLVVKLRWIRMLEERDRREFLSRKEHQ